VKGTLHVTGDTDADALVNSDPWALLLAMLLDQQIPISWAFMGPHRLADRLTEAGLAFTVSALAEMDPHHRVDMFCQKPALHRHPAVMARRAGALAEHVCDVHNGDAAVWVRARSKTLWTRLNAMPGYGEEKSMILMAVLAKRFGVQPKGWEGFAGPFADDQPRSVADMDSKDGIAAVKAWKKRQKELGKTKQE